MNYETDPRLSEPAQYDRQECVDAVNDLCHFLARLPFVQLDQIHYPPNDGWPNIDANVLVHMKKTNEVIALLARLPYISLPIDDKYPSPEQTWCPISPNTYLLDFHGDSVQRLLSEKGADFNDSWPCILPPRFEPPPHVISLTTGINHGNWWLLDTTDGTVTLWKNVDFGIDPDYSPDDPRSWRNECGPETLPIREWVDRIKHDLETLRFIPCFNSDYAVAPLHVLYPEESPERAEKLRAVYREHGWPGDAFRRDGCRAALIEQGSSWLG